MVKSLLFAVHRRLNAYKNTCGLNSETKIDYVSTISWENIKLSVMDNLDLLQAEIPELFQPHDFPPTWENDLIIVPIEDPEAADRDENDLLINDNLPSFMDLENLIAQDTKATENRIAPPNMSPILLKSLGGTHPGGLVSNSAQYKVPPPDCLAFYLPYHYYHPTWWGIYLLVEGVQWLACEIIKRSGGKVSQKEAVPAARMFLYYHEAYHHKTECFATRLELAHRKPFYKTGFECYFQKTWGTDDCLEEALANANALKGNKKMSSRDIESALMDYVKDSPPGYSQGVKVLRKFSQVQRRFAEDNQNICLPHLPGKNPDIWRTTPYMFNGISNIKGRVNYVIPQNSPLVARMRMRPLLPPNKLIKKLKELAQLEFVRSGGKHDIYKTPAGKTIPIPRHPHDLGRGLVHKIIREAGLNMGLEEFMQK